MTLLVFAFFALFFTGVCVGINSEITRPGGTRDLRRQRNRERDRVTDLRQQRDHARAELRRLNKALIAAGSHEPQSVEPMAAPRDRWGTVTELHSRAEPEPVYFS